jgi:hypothetical protein
MSKKTISEADLDLDAPAQEFGGFTQEDPSVVKEVEDRERPVFGLPMGKFGVTQSIPGFSMHIINDYPGRIAFAQQCGYQFVKKSEVNILPGVVSRDRDLGDQVSYVVGYGDKGEPITAYLMKIPLPLKERADALLQQRPDQIEQAIRQGRAGGREDSEFYHSSDTPIKLKHNQTRRF